MIQVGIIGAAGYTGGELIRIATQHPEINIKYASSRSQAGKTISQVHEDLFALDQLQFEAKPSPDVDIVFLCTGHGASRQLLQENPWILDRKVVDLSQDYRMKDDGHSFVYGLPELNKDRIKGTNQIANPGCFATAIQLSLLPLANTRALIEDVHVHAITGSTGAGQKLRATTHFSWRNNNVSVYKAFEHQHVGEIRQSLEQLQPEDLPPLHFIPIRGNYTRGILASVHLRSSLSEADAIKLFQSYYEPHPFTRVVQENPSVKQVVNTNYCLLNVRKHGDILHIVSVMDNLVKGASGQAIQNMNLMFGLDEDQGLKLKSVAF
ncbi:MAG: N-acetyl-gamma-glutamyl-phosphate reductase [Saprospiraceae bacterium]|nr:N-acetyl-gamma-glutamyl-phosphate reductase [Saprospiraceae bacterium]